MKLRFRNNSLRLRVNRREVATLAGGEALREEVRFPGNRQLIYLLESSRGPAAAASFDGNTIRVAAPLADVQTWADSELIGLYFDVQAAPELLKVSIEKDLECVDGPVEERDPEAFTRTPGKNC